MLLLTAPIGVDCFRLRSFFRFQETSLSGVPDMIALAKKIVSKTGYCILSLWLCWHVFCVFIAPAAMPPASPLLERGHNLARPYNEALFLNHGYHYFAPDPGASTLISYTIPRPGDAPIVGRFPDVRIKPRLLYHRYFMLAENLWAFDDDTRKTIETAYAKHFAQKFDQPLITLNRVSHLPSSIIRMQAGGRLDDPEMFESEPIGSFDFSTEAPSKSSIAGNL